MAEDSVFPLADASDVFVFWLGDGPEQATREITKCVVTRDSLTCDTLRDLTIPTADVRVVHAGIWGSGSRRGLPIWCVTVETPTGQYRFWPVNPMAPRPTAADNHEEALALRDVLEALRQHRKPQYEKNPYVRQQVSQRKRRIRLDLDGDVSPMKYLKELKLWALPTRWIVATYLLSVIGTAVLVVGIALLITQVVR